MEGLAAYIQQVTKNPGTFVTIRSVARKFDVSPKYAAYMLSLESRLNSNVAKYLRSPLNVKNKRPAWHWIEN